MPDTVSNLTLIAEDSKHNIESLSREEMELCMKFRLLWEYRLKTTLVSQASDAEDKLVILADAWGKKTLLAIALLDKYEEDKMQTSKTFACYQDIKITNKLKSSCTMVSLVAQHSMILLGQQPVICVSSGISCLAFNPAFY